MHTRKSTSCALTHQLRLEFGQGAQLFLLLVTSKAKRHHAKPAVAKKRKKHTRFKPSYPTVRHRPPPPLELERLKVALPQSPPASRNVTDLSTSSTQLMWEKATCRQAARQSHEKKGKKTPTDRPTVRPHDGGPSLVMSSLHLAATNMHTSSAAPKTVCPRPVRQIRSHAREATAKDLENPFRRNDATPTRSFNDALVVRDLEMSGCGVGLFN